MSPYGSFDRKSIALGHTMRGWKNAVLVLTKKYLTKEKSKRDFNKRTKSSDKKTSIMDSLRMGTFISTVVSAARPLTSQSLVSV